MKKLNIFYLLTLALVSHSLFSNIQGEFNRDAALFQTHQWRMVQQKAKDTVVQIFAFKFEKDILEPYMMPYQTGSRGSGFFIKFENQLFIVTNAHVVDQAAEIHIRIPCFGQRPIRAVLVSICHDRDLALLKIADEELEIVKNEIGEIPFLLLGNSDHLYRADEVLALGYPLGQESLKSTSGVFCGLEKIDLAPDKLLQIDAPINPGSSGGPLLNKDGEVIGINSALIHNSQNVGYSIPVNKLKIILPQMLHHTLVKKPSLGIVSSHASSMAEYLGNPLPGGAYLSEVLSGSPLDKAGIKKNDMIYQINGYSVDIYGDIMVPWSEDRLSIIDYISSIGIEEDINLVIYREGELIERTIHFGSDFHTGIKRVYPGYENIDYEVFAGMVIMELTLNHIELLGSRAPGLNEYANLKNQHIPVLLVTHILPTSALFLTRTIGVGALLNHVNDIKINTLDEFRSAIKKTKDRTFLTLRATDTVSGLTDNIRVALKSHTVIQQEKILADQYRYTLSPTVREIIES